MRCRKLVLWVPLVEELQKTADFTSEVSQIQAAICHSMYSIMKVHHYYYCYYYYNYYYNYYYDYYYY